MNCLSERFDSDDKQIKLIEPFVTFDQRADLREIHKNFATDLDLTSIQLQYNELVQQKIAQKLNGKLHEIIKTLAKDSTNSKNYKEVLTISTRIQACTPHSADVERSISANYRIKTPLRSSISLETEVKYLYVHFNMPDLEDWDPRMAIKQFMNEKQRKDFSGVMDRKAKNAPYFKGIFKSAREQKEDSDEDDEIKTIKKF